MGKIAPAFVKYIIKAKFTADGVIEKPDVIGAIFGQAEGLLGEDLELRELQKKGKIGRIDVTLTVTDSKTIGTVEIPTSIDKTETTLIAAALETIDRVGPCEAKFEIENIEDVRTSKREYILERAKKLMEKFQENAPELKEMQRDIINHSRATKVQEFGKELLAAGPDIENANELIVVEGRADVINLLKAGIKNVIAMNGTHIPQTIKDLSKEKNITLFIDGDRGGLLIAKSTLDTMAISFIARAPDGKEVEELTEKEIEACLRNKIPVDEFKEKYLKRLEKSVNNQFFYEQDRKHKPKSKRKDREYNQQDNSFIRTQQKVDTTINISENLIEENLQNIQSLFYDIAGTKSILLVGLDWDGKTIKVIKKASSTTISNLLRKSSGVIGLIIDGTATISIVKLAERKGCKFIAAKNFSMTSDKLKLISL